MDGIFRLRHQAHDRCRVFRYPRALLENHSLQSRKIDVKCGLTKGLKCLFKNVPRSSWTSGLSNHGIRAIIH